MDSGGIYGSGFRGVRVRVRGYWISVPGSWLVGMLGFWFVTHRNDESINGAQCNSFIPLAQITVAETMTIIAMLIQYITCPESPGT